MRASNPRIDALIQENPGLGKLLQKNTVSSGPRAGQAETEVRWRFWTHSEKTGKQYGHGLTNAQILSDFIICVQPSADANASVTLGRSTFPGCEIIGVYRVSDHLTGHSSASDGGHLGKFDLMAHGNKGDQAVVGWAIVSVGPDGNVRGGGFPTMRGGKMVPYQDQTQPGGGGGEYWGRAATITHGSSNSVPITDH